MSVRAGVGQDIVRADADARIAHRFEAGQLVHECPRGVDHQLGHAGRPRGVVDDEGFVVVAPHRCAGAGRVQRGQVDRAGRGGVDGDDERGRFA